jgi:hypothetical protein
VLKWLTPCPLDRPIWQWTTLQLQMASYLPTVVWPSRTLSRLACRLHYLRYLLHQCHEISVVVAVPEPTGCPPFYGECRAADAMENSGNSLRSQVRILQGTAVLLRLLHFHALLQAVCKGNRRSYLTSEPSYLVPIVNTATHTCKFCLWEDHAAARQSWHLLECGGAFSHQQQETCQGFLVGLPRAAAPKCCHVPPVGSCTDHQNSHINTQHITNAYFVCPAGTSSA